jgi:hypothetical protein
MNTRTRNIAIAAGTAALVLVGVGVGIVVTSDDGDEAASTSSTTTTSSSTTTTTAAPPTTTNQVKFPPNITPADGGGALLSAPPPPVTQSTESPDVDCNALGDAGWTVKACGTASMAGGERVWLVEHKPVPTSATEAWRTLVLQWNQGKGAWLVDLEYRDDDASVVLDINVLESDLTGDGKPELVFGYHFSGSGSILGYDVVASTPGAAPAVAVHRELSHGAALVAEGVITDYDAKYPNNEPNCCPAYIQMSTVSYDAGTWYVAGVASVAAAGAGNL